MAQPCNTTKATATALSIIVAAANLALIVVVLNATRPDASSENATPGADKCVCINVTQAGVMLYKGTPVDADALNPLVRQLTANAPWTRIIVQADSRAPMPAVLNILEQTRMAGLRSVHVSTEERPKVAPVPYKWKTKVKTC